MRTNRFGTVILCRKDCLPLTMKVSGTQILARKALQSSTDHITVSTTVPVECQLAEAAGVEAESGVGPALSEVAVKRVGLQYN